MQAEIISIGDELLIGQTINTNSAWLGEQMNNIGVRIHRATNISDNREEIIAALNEAVSRSQLILMTGGLGPTKDDITKITLCEYFETDLAINEEALERITGFFKSRGLPMLDVNRQQAALPRSCTVIQNMRGTACGMWFEKNDSVVISMPGVPYEMIGMVEDEIIQKIINRFERPRILHRTILTMGVGESFLAKKIEEWENSLATKNINLAYLPSPGSVKLRMSSYGGNSPETIAKLFEQKEKELQLLIGEYIYGYEKETIQDIIGQMLLSRKQTLATAESCTGGFIAHLITSVAGCSAYFIGGIMSYHNDVKTDELSVGKDLIETYGVVSKEVAEAMAAGANQKLKTQWAVATTGVAGPEGGTETTPIGTVWVAVAGPKRNISACFNLGKSRDRTISVASMYALNMLRKEILASGD